jgi:uncharacterized damage-inducible protein DinB
MPRPLAAEYGHFYQGYINRATGNDAIQVLADSYAPLEQFLSQIPADKADYAYAPGKWTLKQMLQHIIDTERIFAYRGLCISRGEQQPLPGFEENDYAAAATAANRTLPDLIEELLLVRKSIILLYKHLNNEDLLRVGVSNSQPLTANAMAFITVGHALHHKAVLEERYLG